MPSTRAVARYIEIVSWAFVLLGLLLPFAYDTPLLTPFRNAVVRWAYGESSIPSDDVRLLGLMLGITGGSIAGKWIVHALIARGPLAEGKAWARDLTLGGLAAWFVVDSIASLWIGATFNVVMINLLPLAVVGLPLLAVHGRFIGAPAPDPEPASTIGKLCFWTGLFGASTGIGIAFGSATPLFAMWWQGLEAAHYSGLPLADSARRLALLFFGPIGGCAFAQFVMLVGFLRRDGETRRVAVAGVTSIAAWCAIDSGYGLVYRGHFNILMINVPALVATLPPWVLLQSRPRRQAKGR